MFLPENARKLLVAARDQYMDCKTPDFPEIELTQSSCGTFKYFKTEKFLFAVFPESEEGKGDGLMIYAFFKRDLSNFSKVCALSLKCDDKIRRELLNVRFDCGEQIFKALCAILHVDPETGKNLEVLEAMLNAPEPAKAKSLGFKIQDFDRKKWDDLSLSAMADAQIYKLRDPTYRDRLLHVARIAKDHGVAAANCFFIEATEATPATDTKPEYPADRIWGSGVGVARMYTEIAAAGITKELKDYLADPIGDSKRSDGLVIDGVQLGSNKLGVAIKTAFEVLVGENYKFIDQSMEKFLQRGLSNGLFDIFAYDCIATEPPAKRSRSEEVVVIDLTCQESMETTGAAPAASTETVEAAADAAAADAEAAEEPAPLCRTFSVRE